MVNGQGSSGTGGKRMVRMKLIFAERSKNNQLSIGVNPDENMFVKLLWRLGRHVRAMTMPYIIKMDVGGSAVRKHCEQYVANERLFRRVICVPRRERERCCLF